MGVRVFLFDAFVRRVRRVFLHPEQGNLLAQHRSKTTREEGPWRSTPGKKKVLVIHQSERCWNSSGDYNLLWFSLVLGQRVEQFFARVRDVYWSPRVANDQLPERKVQEDVAQCSNQSHGRPGDWCSKAGDSMFNLFCSCIADEFVWSLFHTLSHLIPRLWGWNHSCPWASSLPRLTRWDGPYQLCLSSTIWLWVCSLLSSLSL